MLLDDDGRHLLIGTGRADYVQRVSHNLTEHSLLIPFGCWFVLAGHATKKRRLDNLRLGKLQRQIPVIKPKGM